MSVIDDYLSRLDIQQKAALERIRIVVRQTAGNAEEVISYGMPGFKYKGKYLCGFNAFKDHLSFFPTAEPIEVCWDRLKGFKLSKGTIQFTLENPIPDKTIADLVCIRINSINKG